MSAALNYYAGCRARFLEVSPHAEVSDVPFDPHSPEAVMAGACTAPFAHPSLNGKLPSGELPWTPLSRQSSDNSQTQLWAQNRRNSYPNLTLKQPSSVRTMMPAPQAPSEQNTPVVKRAARHRFSDSVLSEAIERWGCRHFLDLCRNVDQLLVRCKLHYALPLHSSR